MMKIDKMTDQEKSVLLARLQPDWIITEEDTRAGKRIWIKDPDYPHATTNLYREEFMALAWRVHLWALDEPAPMLVAGWHTGVGLCYVYRSWIKYRYDLPPVDAQRAWLDKVLSLATEAGLIQEVER